MCAKALGILIFVPGWWQHHKNGKKKPFIVCCASFILKFCFDLSQTRLRSSHHLNFSGYHCPPQLSPFKKDLTYKNSYCAKKKLPAVYGQSPPRLTWQVVKWQDNFWKGCCSVSLIAVFYWVFDKYIYNLAKTNLTIDSFVTVQYLESL